MSYHHFQTLMTTINHILPYISSYVFYCTQSSLVRSLVGEDSEGDSADSCETQVRSLFKMSSSKNPLSTLPTVDYL